MRHYWGVVFKVQSGGICLYMCAYCHVWAQDSNLLTADECTNFSLATPVEDGATVLYLHFFTVTRCRYFVPAVLVLVPKVLQSMHLSLFSLSVAINSGGTGHLHVACSIGQTCIPASSDSPPLYNCDVLQSYCGMLAKCQLGLKVRM